MVMHARPEQSPDSSVTKLRVISLKTPSGIDGLDATLEGGFPTGKSTLVIGPPGSGKTTLALQFLVTGTLRGEQAMIVSFEEPPESLAAGAVSIAWPKDPYVGERLHMFDGRPALDSLENGAFDLGGLIAMIGAESRRLKIDRIAFDGLDALFASSGNGRVNGREFRRLLQFLDAAKLTAVISLKPSSAGERAARFDASEYLSDAVIRLESRLTQGLLQRILRVLKVRGAGFAAGEHPFIISERGFELAYTPAVKAQTIISDERISTGVEGLDHMQAGGLLRSTLTLISGLPGTAKSTFAASFLEAGLRRGERALLVALDEPADQLIRNVRSVGIDLAQFIASGQLTTLSLNAGAAIADEHCLVIERAIDENKPTLLVIDPISALEKSGGTEVSELVVERLAYLVKRRGITAIFTAIAASRFGELESTASHVSTIADTWIHLSYAARGGERNRTLTIVKSRGTAHSNQMREINLQSSGISLEASFRSEGEMLLGTARLEREQQDLRVVRAREDAASAILHELEEQKSAADVKIRDAEVERAALTQRIFDFIGHANLTRARGVEDQAEVMSSRRSAAAKLD
jgi:circadian clock protein KaiC